MWVLGKLCRRLIIAFMCVLFLAAETLGIGEVLWAVNCGGEAHTDIHGIRYQKDYLPVGIPSDYGRSLTIQRVVPQDQILYQTERYHTNTFGYELPLKGDGDYVIVLKFSEVWFTAQNQKVFDVVVNSEHTVVDGLDIFAKVGRGAAHDEVIPFSVKAGKINVGGESSLLDGNKFSVEFLKGDRDNPKINAMYLMKGTLDDVPKLPPMPGLENAREQQQQPAEPEDLEEEELEEDGKKTKKTRKPSGPKVQDPYAADDTGSMMLPVFVAVGAFVPLLFCLCKL